MPAPIRIAPGHDRRIDILKSAAAAFRRRGYHGASVDEIASALEMTKGNLYYYFRNKEEILYACHDYSLDVLLALLEDVQAEASPPDVKLRKLVLAFVHVILDELQGTALTLDLQALSPPLLRKVIVAPRRLRPRPAPDHPAGHGPRLFAPGDPKMVDVRGDGRGELDHASGTIPAGPMSSEAIGSGVRRLPRRRPEPPGPGNVADASSAARLFATSDPAAAPARRCPSRRGAA